jgi:hypothetical protein
MRVYKEQNGGTTLHCKCGEGIVDPHTHVVQSTFEGEINDGVWMV